MVIETAALKRFGFEIVFPLANRQKSRKNKQFRQFSLFFNRVKRQLSFLVRGGREGEQKATRWQYCSKEWANEMNWNVYWRKAQISNIWLSVSSQRSFNLNGELWTITCQDDYPSCVVSEKERKRRGLSRKAGKLVVKALNWQDTKKLKEWRDKHRQTDLTKDTFQFCYFRSLPQRSIFCIPFYCFVLSFSIRKRVLFAIMAIKLIFAL